MTTQLELAAHITTADAGRLSADDGRFLRRLVMDYVACTLAGADTDAAAGVRRAMLDSEDGPSVVLGTTFRASAPVAAFLNAYACHILDYDDVHASAIYHPGAPTISAVLAAAGRHDLPPCRTIAGLVAGYEAGIRVGEAAGKAHYSRHHTTGTVGCVGAAAGVAVALGLEARQVASAIGFAATQAAALWAYRDDGSEAKPVHAGHAAIVGVISAELARSGLHGPTQALECPNGFLATLGGDSSQLSPMTDGGWKFLETSIKAYACCGHIHSGLAAAQELATQIRGAGLTSEEIETVYIESYAEATKVAGVRGPQSVPHARFSYSYVVAYYLVHGSLEGAFSEAGLTDARVGALQDRTTVLHDAQLDAFYPAKQPVVVTVSIRDGRVFAAAAEFAAGSPKNPLTAATHDAKLIELTGLPIEAVYAHVKAILGSFGEETHVGH